MNESLLCKWWWKLENNDGLWQQIVKKKYIKMIPIAQLKRKPTNSPVWNDLLEVRDLYRKGRVMRIGNGMSTDFWADKWCDKIPLKEKFPTLFAISNEINCTVHHMASKNWSISFRR